MTMTVHRGHGLLDSDREIAASRIREHAIAAENFLHDVGAVSIINSDALGMGRIGETARRAWQLAHVQAALAGESGPDFPNNKRVLRYLAKLTHNAAVAHGMAADVGSLQPGRLADIVLWSPAWFGAEPELVIKSGFVAWGNAGSGSGSTRLTQPRRMRPFFGGLGEAPSRLSHIFVSRACLDDRAAASMLPTGHRYSAISDSRGLTCQAMLHNSATPRVEVRPEPRPVTVDGLEVPVHHARRLPLTKTHHLA